MKFDKGTIFLTIASLALIFLLIALTAAVVTGLDRQEAGSPPLSGYSGGNEASLSGPASNRPEPARPVMKTSYYPGIATIYDLDYMRIGYLDKYGIKGHELTLNEDGTITISVYIDYPGKLFPSTYTAGNWYKVKGKGHQIYLDLTASDINKRYPETHNLFIFGNPKLTERVLDIVQEYGRDSFQIDLDTVSTEKLYSDWDSGYGTMSVSSDVLGPYIDSCIPANVARPYIDKGYTGEQAVPYIYYNMPVDAADYFKSRGISGELCGPYYTAGISKEDILAYLDSGYTADQIMPFVRAGVPESDVMAYLDAGYTYDKVAQFINAGVKESDIIIYLNAGITYDKAKPYIGVNASAAIAAPYAASIYTPEQCLPFVNASIAITKARPFLLLNIPSEQAIIYIQNGISAITAKPYVDAGVPAGQAVDEIKKGIPPTK